MPATSAEELRSKAEEAQRGGANACEQCTSALDRLRERVIEMGQEAGLSKDQDRELHDLFSAVRESIEAAHGDIGRPTRKAKNPLTEAEVKEGHEEHAKKAKH